MPRCPKCGLTDPGKCKDPKCPIKAKLFSQKKINIKAKEHFAGKTPNIFVGRYGYPNINVGFLSTEEYDKHDEPLTWSKEHWDIPRIVDKRITLINSRFKNLKNNFNNKFMELVQETSLSHNPVETEITLTKKPTLQLSLNIEASPHGPNVGIKKAFITENVKIPRAVDKIVDDTDFKAAPAMTSLYGKGFDEHYLTKILSAGNLGVKKQRILVPTRWSITATDDTLGKSIAKDIFNYKETPYLSFLDGYLGNNYLVLFFPGLWRYELVEMSVSNGKITGVWTDYENFKGRKDYASNTVGGYYAAKLAVLDYMKEKKRRASVLVLRFISDEYYAPLGVWVCREACRKSMKSKPIEFDNKELLLAYAKKIAKKRFGIDITSVLRKSKLLKELKQQKRLVDY